VPFGTPRTTEAKTKVFEDSFDAKQYIIVGFLLPKVNYIHLNCIRGKWRLLSFGKNMNIVVRDFMLRTK
jgi:hypothetical protein